MCNGNGELVDEKSSAANDFIIQLRHICAAASSLVRRLP